MVNNKNTELIKEFETYLKNSHYSSNTIYNYILDLKDFLKECNLNLSESSNQINEQVEKYFSKISNKLSQRSIYRHTKSLKCFFKFLSLNDIIDAVPNIPKLKFIPKLPERLEDEEIKRIFTACSYIQFPYRTKVIVSLLYACGLRVSELTNLKLNCIDFDAKFIKVLGKNRKERIIPISDRIVNLINMYMEKERRFFKFAQSSEYLLLSKRSNKITRIQIFNLIKKLRQLAGINKKVYPHLLRHSFATKLLENGVNLRFIQELLGHSKLSTTTVYTHIDYKKLQEIYDKYF